MVKQLLDGLFGLDEALLAVDAPLLESVPRVVLVEVGVPPIYVVRVLLHSVDEELVSVLEEHDELPWVHICLLKEAQNVLWLACVDHLPARIEAKLPVVLEEVRIPRMLC